MGVAEFRNAIVILLVYLPTDSVLALDSTVAVRFAVAVPLVGETCSQFPPVIGVTDAVNPALPPLAVSVSVCAVGALPP